MDSESAADVANRKKHFPGATVTVSDAQKRGRRSQQQTAAQLKQRRNDCSGNVRIWQRGGVLPRRMLRSGFLSSQQRHLQQERHYHVMVKNLASLLTLAQASTPGLFLHTVSTSSTRKCIRILGVDHRHLLHRLRLRDLAQEC